MLLRGARRGVFSRARARVDMDAFDDRDRKLRPALVAERKEMEHVRLADQRKELGITEEVAASEFTVRGCCGALRTGRLVRVDLMCDLILI